MLLMDNVFLLLVLGSESNAVHCVIDRHLITAQNIQSTVIAVQNLILLCSLRFAQLLILLASLMTTCILRLCINRLSNFVDI